MNCPRHIGRYWPIFLGILLLPPLCWIALVAVAPTDWARNRISARLSERTGRSVRLQALHIGTFGGIRIKNLEIGTPQSTDNPWLKVANARCDLNLFQLFTPQAEPTHLDVEGLALRILRRKDGSLELADLIQPMRNPALQGTTSSAAPLELEIQIHDAEIVLIDEPTDTKLNFAHVEGRATRCGPITKVQELHGILNGGPFELVADLDRTIGVSTFEGQIRASGVALEQGMHALRYLVPVIGDAATGVDGKLDLNLYLKGRGTSCADVRQSLLGTGSIKLDPIQFEGTNLVAELGRIVDLTGQNKMGAIKTDFALKDKRISTNDLTVSIGRTSIVLNGWTDFDGKLDYRVKTDQLIARLPGKARSILAELAIDVQEVAAIKVQGTVDDLVVTLDGVPVSKKGNGPNQAAPTRFDDKERLRELGNRLKERLLR